MSEWITTEDGTEYKDITTNGAWEVIRFRHDAAIYSFCHYCGYIHPCYKEDRTIEIGLKIEYASGKEYNFCPICGTRMLEELNDYFRND